MRLVQMISFVAFYSLMTCTSGLAYLFILSLVSSLLGFHDAWIASMLPVIMLAGLGSAHRTWLRFNEGWNDG